MVCFFGHARKTGERTSAWPTALDNKRLDESALLSRALERDPRSVGNVEDVGLGLAAGASLNGEQRRSLIARLTRPDYPGLVA